MIAALASPGLAGRFVRRTTLAENEYRTNFKQIDNDIIQTLTSREARQVTPLMATIYLSLLAAPLTCWEREGVLHFVGEDRLNESLTAWEQMRALTGVANSTLSKALSWMHEQAVIGYDARANGVGIRVFFNRASASIRPKAAQKNLRLVPTPSAASPTPSNGIAFKETCSEKILEIDFRADARGAISKKSVASPAEQGSTALTKPVLHLVTEPTNQPLEPAPNPLPQQMTAELRREIATAVQRETAETKTWLDKFGLPKAARVAQRETYDLLRSLGVINNKTADPGRAQPDTVGAGQRNTEHREALTHFLRECSSALQQAAMVTAVPANDLLRAACCDSATALAELSAELTGNEGLVLDDLETQLQTLETRLQEALWTNTLGADLDQLQRTARTELQRYQSGMGAEIFEATVKRKVLAWLQERHQIPRLSLFYLQS